MSLLPKGERSMVNPAISALGGSPTLAINERCARMRKEGKRIYHLGFGESPFPVPEQVVEALKQHAHENRYLAVQGLLELREAVSHYHKQHDKVAIGPEDIIIGPGSKMLMYLVQLAHTGEAIIPTPTWVSYLPQAQLAGKRAHLIHTSFESSWKLTPEQLEETIGRCSRDGQPMLILNYPGNPTGLSYSEREVKALAGLCREHRLLVLSDEIYGGLHHRAEHVSFARHYPEGTVVSSGMSKVFGAGGWRLGTLAFPREQKELLDAVRIAAGETFSTASAPIQHAAAVAFTDRDGAIAEELGRIRKILGTLGKRCAEMLADAGILVHPPDGAFYLFPDFSPHAGVLAKQGIRGCEALCERLLEESGVVLLPGAAFLRPREELTARLAFVDFDGKEALVASAAPQKERIDGAFIEHHCGRTLKAVRLICEWLGAKQVNELE